MRLWLKAAAGFLAFAAVGAPRDGVSQVSQLSLDSGSNDEQRELIARIEAEQTLHGINAADLIGPLTDLALFYREHGDRGLAIAAAERAVGIVRMNLGLKSLEQAPLIGLLSQTEESRGNVERSWALEQELVELVKQHPGDLGTVPIWHDLAARRAGVLQRYRSGEFPPQIYLGCYYSGGPLQPHGASGCRAGSRGDVIGALWGEAQTYRWTAVRTILGNDLYASGRLDELAAAVVDDCRRYRVDPLDPCADEAGLVDQLAYEVGSSVPRVDALIRIADWQVVGPPWWHPFPELMFRLPTGDCIGCGGALETYRRAYRQLEREGVAQAVIDRIFAPRVPVVLPGFGRNPFSEPVGGSGRYIDVAFNVTEQGRAVNVEIRDATPDVSRHERLDAITRIENRRFRPMMTNGEFVDAAPVVVRYDVDAIPVVARYNLRH